MGNKNGRSGGKVYYNKYNDHVIYDRSINYFIMFNLCCTTKLAISQIDIMSIIVRYMVDMRIRDLLEDALKYDWIYDKETNMCLYKGDLFHLVNRPALFMKINEYTFPHYFFIRSVRSHKKMDLDSR